MTHPLLLGTRGSLLARTQSQSVAEAITAATGLAVELRIIRTEGDDVRIPLGSMPRPGAFVARLREALADGEIDLVVHSFKDLPSAPLPGISVAAVPTRADPRDALCARNGWRLADLPQGARVGTSSPRRAAGLSRARPDLEILPIRGNVDTRLGKVSGGELDAVVLAMAGLGRIGRTSAVTELLDPALFLPAPAQGALAVECRTGTLERELALIDDTPSRLAVTAERAVLAGIQASCTTAVGALARWLDDERLELAADLTDHLGVAYAHAHATAAVADAAAADDLGKSLAAELLAG